jgi:hypothetical protein
MQQEAGRAQTRRLEGVGRGIMAHAAHGRKVSGPTMFAETKNNSASISVTYFALPKVAHPEAIDFTKVTPTGSVFPKMCLRA